jgi:hypothetical protein
MEPALTARFRPMTPTGFPVGVVAQDLEAEPLAQAFRTFFRGMEHMRKGLELAEGARHPWQKRLYFLLAAEAYLEALEGLWKRRPKTAK